MIPLGYADGYPRALSNKADVLVAGQRVPVVGLVSMDCVAVDLGNVPEAQVGDEAVLIGRQGDEWITVEELSARASTIVEELASRLTGRLPRRYVEAQEGEEQ